MKIHPFKNLVSHFPEGSKKPRPQQIEAFKKIEEGFNLGKKVIILRAPTGSGKSYIAKTLANATDACSKEFKDMVDDRSIFDYNGDRDEYIHAKKAFETPRFGASILTVTKLLQDQYEEDFKDVVTFKGKSNYPCMVDNMFDCEFAPCSTNAMLKKECLAVKRCPYFNQQSAAAQAKINSLNYSIFLTSPTHVSARQLLVFDEASEIEKELVANFTVEVDTSFMAENGIMVNKIPTEMNLGGWCMDIVSRCSVPIEELKKKLNEKTQGKRKLNRSEISKYKYLNNISMKLGGIADDCSTSPYCISCSADGRFVKIQPVYVNKIAQRIFKESDFIVLMSATIIDVEGYAKRLGLTEKDYHFVDIKSNFDPKKSPIYLMDKFYLTYATTDKLMPKVVDVVKELVDAHDTEKGIIHTHNFKITEALKTKLKGKRFLYRDEQSTNNDILEKHFESDQPTVLISPSMTHGVDLKDEFARFQIIMKAPYMPTTDARVKRLFEEDKQWYVDQMLSTVIQACGRGTRNENDHCVTYITDACVMKAIIDNRDKLPPDFLARIQ